jgi:hypothetical protein
VLIESIRRDASSARCTHISIQSGRRLMKKKKRFLLDPSGNPREFAMLAKS